MFIIKVCDLESEGYIHHILICKSQEDYSSWFTNKRNRGKLSKQEMHGQNIFQTAACCLNNINKQTRPNGQTMQQIGQSISKHAASCLSKALQASKIKYNAAN